MIRLAIKAAAACILLAACSDGVTEDDNGGLLEVYRDTSQPISSAALFDPARYTGVWHEVARYPVPFERGCVGVTAEYQLIATDHISVQNICRDETGEVLSVIDGSAEIVGPGQLKVSFPSVPFGAADYWVLWVDEGYRTAVVGAPNGRSGWILNRDPIIPADRLEAARQVLAFNGYDLSRLLIVPQ
ncbi:lipocalin family protein [Yoonia sp. 208BN28-4]|uniref:lipocalin family protein n=1 Tax=Yoonia sp. 208BN28-4 TaxID=3126505 RepID=UPI0030B11FB1